MGQIHSERLSANNLTESTVKKMVTVANRLDRIDNNFSKIESLVTQTFTQARIKRFLDNLDACDDAVYNEQFIKLLKLWENESKDRSNISLQLQQVLINLGKLGVERDKLRVKEEKKERKRLVSVINESTEYEELK